MKKEKIYKATAYFVAVIPFLIIFLSDTWWKQVISTLGGSGAGWFPQLNTVSTRIIGGIPATVLLLLGIVTLITPDTANPGSFVVPQFEKKVRMILLLVLLLLLGFIYWVFFIK